MQVLYLTISKKLSVDLPISLPNFILNYFSQITINYTFAASLKGSS